MNCLPTVLIYPPSQRPRCSLNSHADEPAEALADWLENQKGRCLIAAESPGRREMLTDLLRHRGIRMPVLSNWQEFISSNLPLAIP